jgi:uncharacterized protein
VRRAGYNDYPSPFSAEESLRSPCLVSALGLLLSVASSASAASPLPSKPTRYATDRAGVIPALRLEALNERLAAFERETSNQVLVYVDRRVPADTTLEEMGAAAIRAWGVGQKGRDNGVIFFVFIDQRAMRIEVGYGLEGAIPDLRAKRITSETVKPYFKRGDYAGGIEAGTEALLAAARSEGNKASPPSHDDSRLLIPLVIVGLAFVAIGFMVFIWRIASRHRRPEGWTIASDSSSWSSSSSSDSSSSSSDFSGGGGDGGGGGSSDSW